MKAKQAQGRKKSIGSGENPFEMKKNRAKFAVLGKKVKGTVVRTSRSNAAGTELRKKTIGAEFELRGKTGQFIDKRIGENEDLSEADKMGIRFHQERLRQTRNLFSLADQEEPLTHLGMRLGDDTAPGNTLEDNLFFHVGEDEEFGGGGGLVDQEAVQALHFGGGDDAAAPERKKSKREIMDEIVAKSKMFKAERRRENHEQLLLIQEVDEKFKSITPFLSLKPTKKRQASASGGEKAASGSKADDFLDQDGEDDRAPSGRAHEEDYEPDDYDKLVNELRATSRQAKAGDRMQSKEEEARMRMERLKSLEVMRERRMGGVVMGMEEQQDEDAQGNGSAPVMDIETLKKRVAAGLKGDDDDLDEEEEEEDHAGSDSAEASGDDGDNDGDEGTGGGTRKKESNRHKKKRLRRSKKKRDHLPEGRGAWILERRWRRGLLEEGAAEAEGWASKEAIDARTGEVLPFVLPVPSALEDLWALLEGNNVETCRTVLERMLQCSDPLLNPSNAEHLLRLQVGLLVFALRREDDADAPACVEMVFDVLRRLVLLLPGSSEPQTLQAGSPFFAYRVLLNAAAGVEPCIPSGTPNPDQFRSLVPLAAATSGRRASARRQGAVYRSAGGFPTLATALTLLHFSRLFSASDASHPLWTPAQALLCGWLAAAPVTNFAELRTGCLVAAGLLPVLQDSLRFSGEPVAFLCQALHRFATGPLSATAFSSTHPHWPKFEMSDRAASSRLQRACVMALNAWTDALASWMTPGALLTMLIPVLEAFKRSEVSGEELARIEMHVAVARKSLTPLRMRPQARPVAKDVEPKLLLGADLSYRAGDPEPDAARREEKRLQKRLKAERRGAMRELRRDREFLNTLKAQEFEEETGERKEAWRSINAFLQQGQAEANQEEKAKAKKSRLKL